MRIREARPEDAEAIARVHVASWKTTYAGLIPESYIAKQTVERREAMWRQALEQPERRKLIFVAEEAEGRIVGFANGGRNRSQEPEPDLGPKAEQEQRGELYAIYLLQAYQRTGAGTKLFHSVQTRLREQGYRSMLLWVLQGNPALAFYEAQGGTIIGQKEVDFDGEKRTELAIGWARI